MVSIGPPGAGKTTAMRAVAEAWCTTGHRVIPLVPSAAAAGVLGAELGCQVENRHKFQHAHTRSQTPGGPGDGWFVLHPGDLVLVDEAGRACTLPVDWVSSYPGERGAVELTDLHRFTDPAKQPRPSPSVKESP